MIYKLHLQNIILQQKDEFSFDKIHKLCKNIFPKYPLDKLSKDIKNIISIYLRNGVLGIYTNGYKVL